MKRKIYNRLLQWKQESQGETALLIDGARRVGKSYIVREFAQKEYKSYILIDFNKANAEIKKLFEDYLDNFDTFFMYLSAYTSTRCSFQLVSVTGDTTVERQPAWCGTKYSSQLCGFPAGCPWVAPVAL